MQRSFDLNWLSHRLYTDSFDVGGHEWRLLSFISKSSSSHGDQLSLYLDSPKAAVFPQNMNPTAEFTLKLINQLDEARSFQKDSRHRFSAREVDWGFRQFFSLEEIEDTTKGWLREDNHIEIQCSIRIIYKKLLRAT